MINFCAISILHNFSLLKANIHKLVTANKRFVYSCYNAQLQLARPMDVIWLKTPH